ncbi:MULTISPECIES: tripartite tricarboxylate transporter substrate binding protein [unclassified Achromobacter]|uniref:Bug family tripartite tricarboxylate transporter substrate binding protein n=1 Tax=unclassified Achromobacter TaxID=2626865 RepID=UPI000B51D93A|nr:MULTISPECIES: tripartite tricarboxylate transporter substrate binding protein [unclassified Achromobacter]OWT77308.1 ABC transporter substrate-binding protein [Achromobacter sp. HZ28]OWT78189.1 ABC transporter substrate-binding protein [Achromobacter sp. HZ34]
MTSSPAITLRRRIATGALLASTLLGSLAATGAARADEYPDKPVKVVVAFTAGGTTDILTRSVSNLLGQKFKQSFIVENKPGAGGNIGTEYVARSAPDGYTLIVDSVGPIAVNSSLNKLNYDPLVDLVPVIQIADVPNVLVVPPDLPIHNMKEFLAYAKAHSGKLNYSSTGIGTSSHLSSYMLMQLNGVQATHVPYKGADALNDLLTGRVQFMFATIPSVIGQIKAGKLRAIAVSSARRSASMPDIPSVAESGFPGFEAGSWFGMFAPKGTPPDVIAKLNTAINGILPQLKDKMIAEGADPVGGTAADFDTFTHAEQRKWSALIKQMNTKAE